MSDSCPNYFPNHFWSSSRVQAKESKKSTLDFGDSIIHERIFLRPFCYHFFNFSATHTSEYVIQISFELLSKPCLNSNKISSNHTWHFTLYWFLDPLISFLYVFVDLRWFWDAETMTLPIDDVSWKRYNLFVILRKLNEIHE